MHDTLFLDLLTGTFQQLFWLSLPLLGILTLVGLVSALVQSAFSIHDQALSLVPKMVTLFAFLIIAGPWMLDRLCWFTTYLLEDFSPFLD